MSRPRLCRRVQFDLKVTYLKPQGIPISQLEIIKLTHEELEALRLKNIDRLDQKSCVKK